MIGPPRQPLQTATGRKRVPHGAGDLTPLPGHGERVRYPAAVLLPPVQLPPHGGQPWSTGSPPSCCRRQAGVGPLPAMSARLSRRDR